MVAPAGSKEPPQAARLRPSPTGAPGTIWNSLSEGSPEVGRMRSDQPGEVSPPLSRLRGSACAARGLSASRGMGKPLVSAAERSRRSVMAKKFLYSEPTTKTVSVWLERLKGGLLIMPVPGSARLEGRARKAMCCSRCSSDVSA